MFYWSLLDKMSEELNKIEQLLSTFDFNFLSNSVEELQ